MSNGKTETVNENQDKFTKHFEYEVKIHFPRVTEEVMDRVRRLSVWIRSESKEGCVKYCSQKILGELFCERFFLLKLLLVERNQKRVLLQCLMLIHKGYDSHLPKDLSTKQRKICECYRIYMKKFSSSCHKLKKRAEEIEAYSYQTQDVEPTKNLKRLKSTQAMEKIHELLINCKVPPSDFKIIYVEYLSKLLSTTLLYKLLCQVLMRILDTSLRCIIKEQMQEFFDQKDSYQVKFNMDEYLQIDFVPSLIHDVILADKIMICLLSCLNRYFDLKGKQVKDNDDLFEEELQLTTFATFYHVGEFDLEVKKWFLYLENEKCFIGIEKKCNELKAMLAAINDNDEAKFKDFVSNLDKYCGKDVLGKYFCELFFLSLIRLLNWNRDIVGNLCLLHICQDTIIQGVKNYQEMKIYECHRYFLKIDRKCFGKQALDEIQDVKDQFTALFISCKYTDVELQNFIRYSSHDKDILYKSFLELLKNLKELIYVETVKDVFLQIDMDLESEEVELCYRNYQILYPYPTDLHQLMLANKYVVAYMEFSKLQKNFK